MEQDCWTFLAGFSSDELENRDVLIPWGDSYQLKANSVGPLIRLMRENGVTRLVAKNRRWFLTSDGEFANPGSPSEKRGRVADLRGQGDVFTTQNRHINPHYDSSGNTGRVQKPEEDLEAAQKEIARLEADLAAVQREVARIPGLEADLEAAQEERDRYENRVRELEKEPTPLKVGVLAEMKSGLRHLADEIEGTTDDIYPGRILNLSRDYELIPKLVASVMLMILQARNNLEHPPHKLSPKQDAAVRAAWEVVREWASASGFAGLED